MFRGEIMTYTQKEFLNKIKAMVLDDMRSSGILASLTAAQALIESRYGNSELAVRANNLFGIKGSYYGESVNMLTTEYYGGQPYKVKADFRKYPSWAESIADHSAMFNRMSRYKNLRGCTDWQDATIFVQRDGYATSPTYSETLQKCIITYGLNAWDKEVLEGQSTSDTLETSEPKNGNPYKEPTKNVKYNSRGNDVRWLQVELNRKGYKLVVDGIFKDKTKQAVIDFQKKAFPDKPEEWDGIVGIKTRMAINTATEDKEGNADR
jgi:flagellum-specific peptidoglycan hydrolase FlgJ